MDYTNIIIAACTAIGTILTIVSLLGKRFDRIDAKLDDLNSRVSRLEGIMWREYNGTDKGR